MFTINTVFMHEMVFKTKLLTSCDAIANCTKQHDAESYKCNSKFKKQNKKNEYMSTIIQSFKV